ncbi:MAG: hypothetical protein ACOCT0_02180 [Halobacteriota archaeon]
MTQNPSNRPPTRDPLDWLVVVGDDLKLPLLQNADSLEEETASRTQAVFDRLETELERRGYEATRENLIGRGLELDVADDVLHEVIAERLANADVELKRRDLIDGLPERREGVGEA